MGFAIGQFVRCINTINTGIDEEFNLIGVTGKIEDVNHTYNHELPYFVNFGKNYGHCYMSDANLEDASGIQDSYEYSNTETITVKFHESLVAEKLIKLFDYEIVKTHINEDEGLITYILMEEV